ncbi:N-acetyltransferase [Bacillus salacetis]|uniref:N-acetyltransferase n=1 Tax=Bacillus salacetis TaxID=2315464 RepID=A0A3A1R9I7_9BACI|nr:GNAT family protein [Bacillus salacetis]RIW38434.1 N-acetyltransferase [Bacillus salacetis]
MKTNLLEKIPDIELKHYYLTGINETHAAKLFTFLGDGKTMKFLTPHPPQSVDEVTETIHKSLEQFHSQKEIPWVIIEKKTNEVIGLFRLHKLNLWHKKTEMGVVLSNTFQRKGVMSEILPEVLSFCFNELELNRVVGDIFADNTGSRKLLLANGFKEEGVLRQTDFDGEKYHDTVVFSILKSEYEYCRS